jgi:hypothetical protein
VAAFCLALLTMAPEGDAKLLPDVRSHADRLIAAALNTAHAGSISNVPCSGNGPLRAASSLPVSCRNGRLPVRRAKCVRMKEFPPGSKRDPCCVRPMCTGSNKNRPGFQISDQATLNADPICLRIRHEAEPAESQGSLGCQLLSRHKAEKSQGKKT